MEDGDPFATTELNRESRKYVHVRLRHIQQMYDENEEMEIFNTYYPLTRCSEEFFNKTEFERNMYKILIDEG